MIDYYANVAPALLPHIAGRALTLGRFPAGVEGHGFAQTECRGCPSWMTTHPLALRDGRVRRFCVVNDRPSLLWVANQSAIELHPFLARTSRQDQPTHVVVDLDPGPGAGLLDCCRVALRAREMLGELGLEAFVKHSGSTGLHVLVPLDLPHRYEQTKPFARACRPVGRGRAGRASPTVCARRARAVCSWTGSPTTPRGRGSPPPMWRSGSTHSAIRSRPR